MSADPLRSLIDGRPDDTVSVLDRGLQYGDGLFETIAVFAGQPCLWQSHIARLAAGCERLGFARPDADALRDDAAQLIQGCERAVLKVLVTRGQGGRGYRPPAPARPRRIVTLHEWPEYPEAFYEHGVRVRWCDTPLSVNSRLAGLKHCNRLDQVLARSEWDDPAVAEGLMCDESGQVIEGTMTNLFVFSNGALQTPTLDRCGVAGIARDQVLAAAQEQALPVSMASLDRQAVLNADAVFLTNALIGVWPVAELAGHTYDPIRWPRDLFARVVERCRQP